LCPACKAENVCGINLPDSSHERSLSTFSLSYATNGGTRVPVASPWAIARVAFQRATGSADSAAVQRPICGREHLRRRDRPVLIAVTRQTR